MRTMSAVLERVTDRRLRRGAAVRRSKSVKRLFLALVAVVAVSTTACSKKIPGEAESTDSLTARGGVPDDSIKPKPIATGTGARVGTADDGVKPVLKPTPVPPSPTPIPYPNNPRGGVPDDSVKPAPVPTMR